MRYVTSVKFFNDAELSTSEVTYGLERDKAREIPGTSQGTVSGICYVDV